MSKFRSVPAGLVMSKYRKIAGEQASEYKRLSLTLGGVVPRRRDDTEGLQPASLEGYQVLPEGSLVFKLIDLENIATSRVGLSSETGIVSPAYIVTRVRSDRLLAKFGYYSFWDLYKRNYFNNIGSEGVRRALNYSDLARIRIPLPPLETQRRIADYLDRETAEIDAAVADLDRYVELLEKRRLLIVDEILCKSKFPAAPIFTVASLKSGDSITSEYIQKSGEFPVYGGNGLRGYTNNYNQESDRILIGRQGALCGNIHLAKGPFFATEHALVVSPRDSINLVWFEHALRDLNLGNLSQASAQPGISAGEVVRQRVHLPPLSVQNEIATRISLEINQIDSIIADSTRLRDLLLKRRYVLITEVVTGRKRV